MSCNGSSTLYCEPTLDAVLFENQTYTLDYNAQFHSIAGDSNVDIYLYAANGSTPAQVFSDMPNDGEMTFTINDTWFSNPPTTTTQSYEYVWYVVGNKKNFNVPPTGLSYGPGFFAAQPTASSTDDGTTSGPSLVSPTGTFAAPDATQTFASSSSPSSSSSDSSGLPAGAIAGVVVGIVVVLCAFVAAIFCLSGRRKSTPKDTQKLKDSESDITPPADPEKAPFKVHKPTDSNATSNFDVPLGFAPGTAPGTPRSTFEMPFVPVETQRTYVGGQPRSVAPLEKQTSNNYDRPPRSPREMNLTYSSRGPPSPRGPPPSPKGPPSQRGPPSPRTALQSQSNGIPQGWTTLPPGQRPPTQPRPYDPRSDPQSAYNLQQSRQQPPPQIHVQPPPQPQPVTQFTRSPSGRRGNIPPFPVNPATRKPVKQRVEDEEAKVEDVVLPVGQVQGVEKRYSIKSVAGKIERRQSLSPPGTPVRMVAQPGPEASGAAGFEEAKKEDSVIAMPEVSVVSQSPVASQAKRTDTEKVVRDAVAATAAAAAAALVASQVKKAAEPEKKVVEKPAPAAAVVAPQVKKAVEPKPKFEQSTISTRELAAPAQISKSVESEKKVGLPPSPRTAATPPVKKPVEPKVSKAPSPASQPSAAPVITKTAPAPKPQVSAIPVVTKPTETKAPSSTQSASLPPSIPVPAVPKPVEPKAVKTPSPTPQPTTPSVQFSVTQTPDAEIKEDMPSVTAVIARLSVQSEIPSSSNRTSLFVESPSSTRVQSAVEITPESPRGSLYEVAPTPPLMISKKEAGEPGKRLSSVSVAPMLPALEQNIRFSFGDLN